MAAGSYLVRGGSDSADLARGDTPGACILWEAENEQHARELIGSLPMAQAGMLEILALVPLKPYPGFSSSNR